MADNADTRLLTLATMRDRLNISERTIRRMVADGQLPGYRVRGRLLFDWREVQQALRVGMRLPASK